MRKAMSSVRQTNQSAVITCDGRGARATSDVFSSPRSFMQRDLIGIMDNQHSDLPASLCLVQHVRDTYALQLLSVHLVSNRNACHQRRRGTQRFNVSHTQLTSTKASGPEAFNGRRESSRQDGAGGRGEHPLRSNE